MRCVCLFVLFFAAQNVFADDIEWITMKKEELCPALYKETLCTDNLINFDDVAESIKKLGKEDSISDDQADSGVDASKCGDPLKKALCSKDASPLCLEDRTSGDDSAERRVCTELYETCPSISNQESLNYTEECARYLKREFTDMKCETVKDFEEGGCPQPTKKMPEVYIQAYKIQSESFKPLRDLLDDANTLLDVVWDPQCLKTVRELPCMPMYCSESDENIVEIRNKTTDCNRAMECVSKSTERLDFLKGELESLRNDLRDAIKDSCNSIIKEFEELTNPTSSKKTGGVSTIQFSISLTLLAVLLCLKIFW